MTFKIGDRVFVRKNGDLTGFNGTIVKPESDHPCRNDAKYSFVLPDDPNRRSHYGSWAYPNTDYFEPLPAEPAGGDAEGYSFTKEDRDIIYSALITKMYDDTEEEAIEALKLIRRLLK